MSSRILSRFLLLSLLVLKLCVLCKSASVLIAIPFINKSHYILMRRVGLELASRGHNITVITANFESDPPENYRQVVIETDTWSKGRQKLNLIELSKFTDQAQHDIYRNATISLTEAALNSTAVQAFLKEDQHFDLVIVNQFYNEAFNLLAHKYHCPLVLISSFGNCMKHNIAIGHPLQMAYLYSEYMSISEFGFWSRVKNLYITIYEYIQWRFLYLPQQESLAQKYLNLPVSVPRLYDVQRKAALLLMNRHFSFDPPAAYQSDLVEIGGLHLNQEVKSLPEDLQQLLDNSTQGVIYMSLGSSVQISDFTTDQRKLFTDAFRRLKHLVLCKSDIELGNMPSNMIIRKWFPQNQILAHPNVHLFITHGGLLSMQEAVTNGVPVLAVPVFGDQSRNAAQAQVFGIGDMVLPSELHQLQNKLQELIDNKETYRRIAARLKSTFQDRPVPALSTAVFWIEHIIVHKTISFSPEADITWIDYYCIDVIPFILLVVIVLLDFVKKLVVKFRIV